MDLTAKGSTLFTISTKFDPEKIKDKYEYPSTDKQYPTGLERKDVAMTGISSVNDAKSQEGTDLVFDANLGDVVLFSPATTPDNSAYAVNIYSIRYYSGDFILSMQETMEKPIELEVLRPGMTTLLLSFGIYTKDSSGKPKDLIGCFYFDPSITIR